MTNPVSLCSDAKRLVSDVAKDIQNAVSFTCEEDSDEVVRKTTSSFYDRLKDSEKKILVHQFELLPEHLQNAIRPQEGEQIKLSNTHLNAKNMQSSPKSQALTKPLYIFIGEQHDDASNVSLVDQLFKSCKKKGLDVAFYPEDDSQIEKMGRGEVNTRNKNLPNDWKVVASAVYNNPAHNKKMHLVGNREKTVFDPFFEPIAGVRSNEGKFTDATGAFSEVMKKITDPTAEGFIGINPAFLPSIKSKLHKIHEAGHKIDDPKKFGHYVKNTEVNLLLSSAIADRMVSEIAKHRGNEDVAIILTGNNHSENVATKLGIPKSEMVMISNCENQFALQDYLKGVKVLPFAVNNDTKMPTIPSSIAEKLTELQISKEAYKKRSDALDLATPQKPSTSPEGSYAQKMVGTSKSGSHEA